jgi:hypothetical protein
MIIKIINLLHALLIIFLCLSIFIDNNEIKNNALVLLIFIFFHYITNYGKCGLTQIEYLYMGEEYKSGFMYRLINPIITVPESYFNKCYYFIHITWIIILLIQLNYYKTD